MLASIEERIKSIFVNIYSHMTHISYNKHTHSNPQARVLERHFTLDKNQKGSDHILSLDPREMSLLVAKVRLIEKNVAQLPVMPDDLLDVVTELNLFENPMGFIAGACRPAASGRGRRLLAKSILPCELMCKHKLGKSLVCARELRKGQRLTELDINVKVSEPNGIPADFYDDVVGRTLLRDVCHDEPLLADDVDDFHVADEGDGE